MLFSIGSGGLFFTYRFTSINPIVPGVPKRSHILKQTCSVNLQVCLGMWTPGTKGVTNFTGSNLNLLHS